MCSSAAMLPEELIVEILARVPYRSLRRFRCVSPSWRTICSDPGLIKRSPKSLSGFFCYTVPGYWIYDRDTRFINFPGSISGRRPLVDPSVAFLRAAGYPYTHGFVVVDCCGGLLLVCEGSKYGWFPLDRDYLVCNPATDKWTVLPPMEELNPQSILRLCVDPADFSRFTVLVFVLDHDDYCRIIGVKIYSSETRTWTSGSEQIGWGQTTSVRYQENTALVSVFMNGTLHLTTNDSHVVTVDMDGKTWSKFWMPYHDQGCIGQSWTPYRDQGCIGQSHGLFHAMHIDHYNGCLLTVWVLEDYARGCWTLNSEAYCRYNGAVWKASS